MSTPYSSPPPPPRGLSRQAAAFFRLVAAELTADGRLGPLHLAQLVNLARDFDLIERLETVLRRDGTTVEEVKMNGTTCVRQRPEVTQLALARRRFDSLAQQFGLTPTTGRKLPEPVKKPGYYARARETLERLEGELGS